MKTNKSLRSRFKVTKNGKVLARKKGQNHNNSKESRRKQLAKHKYVNVILSRVDLQKF